MTAKGRPTREALRGRTVHVAGMSRGGTTYLYHNLQRHPQLFLPERKEICYFGHAHHQGLAWWLDFYRHIRDDQMAVDICGLYFMDDSALDRILEFNPDARVILSLREPMKWIYSIYEHYSTLFETPPIDEFVQGCTWTREGRDIELEFANHKIERTVERLQARLGSSLLLIDFDLIGEDPLRMLKAVEAFCGVEPWFSDENFSKARVNPRGQGNAKLIGRVYALPGVPYLTRILPRPLVMSVRGWLESDRSGGRRGDATTVGRDYSAAQRRAVAECLAADQAYMAGLFSRGPILIGREPYGG